jgi:K+-sensing histidine kinase KdpD
MAASDVQQAIAAQPAHVSHYQLTLEPNTAFAANPPPLPHEDASWDMQEQCAGLLQAAGFEQYEISAWSRLGRASAHNLNYWAFGDYLGIGAGAHAKLSHELRNPLQSIGITASALLADPNVTPSISKYAAIIQRNVELEARLVDDLLDLSRIMTGNLHMELRPLELNSLIREICDTFRPRMHDKGIKLRCDLGKDVGNVVADSGRLRQVLGNLLQNALKFTPKGGSVQVRTAARGDGTLIVAIRDTGNGISPEFLPRLFEPFEIGESQSRAQHGGLGLGLAICQSLCNAHGGTIRASSDGIGQGAEFVVELPADLSKTDRVAVS